MNRTNELSKKASWIALYDGRTAVPGWAADETMTFDYGSPSELFMAKREGGPQQRLGYRRFATAAEAIRFAVEDFPVIARLGAWMQVGDERFDSEDIHHLYDALSSSNFQTGMPSFRALSARFA